MTAARLPSHISLGVVSEIGPPPADNFTIPVFVTDALEGECYAPRGVDPQTPHTRDEVNVVARGVARFFDGAR